MRIQPDNALPVRAIRAAGHGCVADNLPSPFGGRAIGIEEQGPILVRRKNPGPIELTRSRTSPIRGPKLQADYCRLGAEYATTRDRGIIPSDATLTMLPFEICQT